MRKKIGILTFHRADNLGAVLQAYALQSTIEQNFHAQAEIIDYKCNIIEAASDLKISSFKDLIKFVPMKFYYFIKRRGFDKFRKKQLKTSASVCDPTTIQNSASDYDIFITGSDQVWNFDCSGNDLTYFLDFVPESSLKVSFAASIGQYKFTDEQQDRVSALLEDFDRISVREESALRELERIGVYKGIELSDPVILLDKEQWKKIMAERLYRGKYVLVYLVLDDVNTLACAEEYARTHNCKIINNKKSIEFIMHNSPSEFLSWIYYAECVFTNSFHGTAFSLIFNKHLASDVQMAHGGVNNRVKELLAKTDAQRCEISEINRAGCVADAQDKIQLYRQKGIDFLQDVIGD